MKGSPSDLYYYCPGCRFFHHYSFGHEKVDRCLCFHCGKIAIEETEIYGNKKIGYTQICKICKLRVKLPR